MANLHSKFISKEVIKPSSPTPAHLKTYNLSFSDQFAPPVYIPLIFFYPYSGSGDTITSHHENANKILKKSLSQALTQYYPFSGKLVSAPDGSYIDCNDEGVDFVEARVNARLSQVAVHPHYQSQEQHFFPPGTIWGSTYDNNRLVMIQLSYFECGGLAIAVCLSHKIGDTCTLYAFIKHWAAVSHNQRLQQQTLLQPLPPHIISCAKTFCWELMWPKGNIFISKRFIFPNSKIEQLKAQIGMIKANPTRVEVVTSLLHRCAVIAAKANRLSSFFKIFILIQTVNMRTRLANPLQETVMGNLSWCLKIVTIGKAQLALKNLTAQIQHAKSELPRTISEIEQQKYLAFWVPKFLPSMFFEFFFCTSLCGYNVYRVDFGWGKPSRVSFPSVYQYFILMDTPNEDGIEAVVCLREEDMEQFEADEQLLAFAFPA